MKIVLKRFLCLVALLMATSATQAATLTALSSFGGGDGWIAPGETAKLGSASLERGLAYNPVTNNVLFVSRDGGVFVEVLDGVTGADVGNLNVTGITGGTFNLSTIGVGTDGAIYAANLVSPASAANPYKIYRWDNQAAVPAIAFSGMPTATRYGDTIDVIGGGTSTQIIAGHGTPQNNFSIFKTADGLNFTGTSVAIPVSPAPGGVAAGSFRLGITFTDSDTVVGRGDANNGRVVDVDATGTVGTLAATFSLAPGSTLRQLDYAVLGNGIPILAVLQNGGNIAPPPAGGGVGSTSRLFIYDITDPNNPVELAQKSNTTLSNANGNAVGAVAFGKTTYGSAIIYAMDTNNGIQAFKLTGIPEPTSLALLGLCMGLAGMSRASRRS